MGDHRASIKIEFSMYGEIEKADMWINWSINSGECYEVDQRVIDFFRDAYLKMRNKYDDQTLKLEESPQKQWQRLTDEEREQFRQWAHPDIIEAIELKLRERNT